MSDHILDSTLLPATITPEFVQQLSAETLAATLDAWGAVIGIYDLDKVAEFFADPDAERLSLKSLAAKADGLHLSLAGDTAEGFMHVIAAAATGFLQDKGAENYVEAPFTTAEPTAEQAFDTLDATGTDGTRWTLTVRPHFGETPGAQAYRYGAAITRWVDAHNRHDEDAVTAQRKAILGLAAIAGELAARKAKAAQR